MSEYKREIEARGQNVEAAVESGLAKLGLSRGDVIVEILDEGSRGLLGIGARDAMVRLTAMTPVKPPAPKPVEPVVAPPPPVQPIVTAVSEPEPVDEEVEEEEVVLETAVSSPSTDGDEDTEPDPEEAKVVQELLETMLDKMHVKATVHVDVSEPDDLTGRRVNVLDIQGEDLTVLIGPRGETLSSLQYITRLMAGHKLHRRASFVVDVQGYRQRRELALSRLAERMAKKALREQRPISLEPMPPYERRIIHMTLRDHKDVYTQSVGEGDRRKVRILLK
ncbi:MAG: protein jag [Anaerolineales bacterium]|nr:protein jag [Anaerolineales bacterium]MCB8966423.1 protein jag [Ardenticatenaceae bacterium]